MKLCSLYMDLFLVGQNAVWVFDRLTVKGNKITSDAEHYIFSMFTHKESNSVLRLKKSYSSSCLFNNVIRANT